MLQWDRWGGATWLLRWWWWWSSIVIWIMLCASLIDCINFFCIRNLSKHFFSGYCMIFPWNSDMNPNNGQLAISSFSCSIFVQNRLIAFDHWWWWWWLWTRYTNKSRAVNLNLLSMTISECDHRTKNVNKILLAVWVRVFFGIFIQ